MMKRMHYQPWVGLPNILLRDFAVPELLQDDATPGEDRRRGASRGSTIPARAEALRVALRGACTASCAATPRGSPPMRSRQSSRRRLHADLRPQAALIVDVSGLMAGVDEVGRGPLAGPVVAAAVILDEKRPIRGLNDSKLLTPEERERLDRRDPRQGAVLLQRRRGERRGDRHAQHPAGHAAGDAARGRRPAPAAGNRPGRRQPAAASWRCRCAAVVGGDAKVRAISAASILAKVHRDRLCLQLHERASAVRLRRPQGLLDARAPGGAARARRLPAPPAQLRAGARASWTGCSEGATVASTGSRTITSRDNPLLVRLRKLARRSGARTASSAQVWLEGEHLCAGLGGARRRAGAAGARQRERLAASRRLRALAEAAAGRRSSSPTRLMAELSTLESPAPIGFRRAAAGAAGDRAATRRASSSTGCRTPATSAAILRSAAAFGFAPGDRARGHGGALVAQGAARRHGRALRRCAWSRAVEADALDALTLPLVGTSSHAEESVADAALAWPCAWVFGHEGAGASAAVQAAAPGRAHPAAGRRGVAQRRRGGRDLPVRIDARRQRPPRP